MSTSRSHPRPRTAFTLIELLVIIVILGVMIAAGVPAIRSIIQTSSASLAESQLKLALSAARDIAIRNPSTDSAAVFTFEPGGRLTIIPMVHVGTLLDRLSPADTTFDPINRSVLREVFAPTPLAEPVQLPAGWMIRGYAPPAWIYAPGLAPFQTGAPAPSNGWYFEGTGPTGVPTPGNRQFDLNAQNDQGNWVFPETAFFNPDRWDDGDNRQTFLVRFKAGTGAIAGASAEPVIVLLPRPFINPNLPDAFPNGVTATSPAEWRRVDRADNLINWARAVLELPPRGNPAPADLIGSRSSDVALACAVNLVALYSETTMSQAIGARQLNRVTGTIYGVQPSPPVGLGAVTEPPRAPNIDLSLWPASANATAQRVQTNINKFITSSLRQNDVVNGGGTAFVETDARIFTVDTYLGSVQEVR